MRTLMDESRRKSNLYNVTKYSCSLHIISDRCFYLYHYIYNTKFKRYNYYVNADVVNLNKPNLYDNSYKYYFGLQFNSKSSKTLYERGYRI